MASGSVLFCSFLSILFHSMGKEMTHVNSHMSSLVVRHEMSGVWFVCLLFRFFPVSSKFDILHCNFIKLLKNVRYGLRQMPLRSNNRSKTIKE